MQFPWVIDDITYNLQEKLYNALPLFAPPQKYWKRDKKCTYKKVLIIIDQFFVVIINLH